jgi:hypothetical protein
MATKTKTVDAAANQSVAVKVLPIQHPQLPELQALVKRFQLTIFHQSNLIPMALEQVLDGHTEKAEALTVAIGRLNDDIFALHQALYLLAFGGVEEGGAE